MIVPQLDLKIQYQSIKEEINESIQKVLESGQFILDENVKLLEQEIASYCGVKFGIGLNSGTDALYLALRAFNIGPGDEIITSPFSFIATAEVITLVGAKTVFVDIDLKTFNIDINKIEEAITRQTKAIIPVHLYGQAADMDAILEIARRYNLRVIEDAAQAIDAEYKGRKVCSLGDMGCLSFYPTKNLGAYGDGGMVLTSNEEMAEKVAMLRTHGWKVRYNPKFIGVNSRLDAIQAVILRVKLNRLKEWTEKRRANAYLYNELLKDSGVITPWEAPYNKHVYHQYTIRAKDRDALREWLARQGISTAVHYPLPIYLQEAYKSLGYREGDFPVSEQASREVLSLPMYPELTKEQIETVAEAIRDFKQS